MLVSRTPMTITGAENLKKELQKLISTIKIDVNLTSYTPNYEEIDYEAPLLSLPHLFKTDIFTIPYSEKYIHADNRKIKFWKKTNRRTF